MGGASGLEGGNPAGKNRSDSDSSTGVEAGCVHGEWWKRGKAPKVKQITAARGLDKEQG